jgi:hypothetical protein
MEEKKFTPIRFNPSRIPEGHEKFSFLKGFRQLPIGVVPEACDKIMKAMNLTSRSSFYNRLYGVFEPRVSEWETTRKNVEKVFAEYGITDCWGA